MTMMVNQMRDGSIEVDVKIRFRLKYPFCFSGLLASSDALGLLLKHFVFASESACRPRIPNFEHLC